MAVQMRCILSQFKLPHPNSLLLRSSLLHKNNPMCLRTIAIQRCTRPNHNFCAIAFQGCTRQHQNFIAISPHILQKPYMAHIVQCRGFADIDEFREKQEARNRGLRRGIFLSLIVLVVSALGMKRLSKVLQDERKLPYTPPGKKTSAVGGPWKLKDLDGNPIGDEDFAGQWFLMYFGYTYCPDICPDELEKFAGVLNDLAKNPKLPKIKMAFISVDPRRDTPDIMRKYCEEFHKDIVGVTGEASEIMETCRTFRIYYQKSFEDNEGDYIIDHTIITYLVNPEGHMEHFYYRRNEKDEIVKDITERILAEKK